MPDLPRLALALAPLVLIGAAPTTTLTVEVANVRNASGVVHVDVCPQARFLKEDCPYSAEAPARAGVTAIVVPGVPAGRYAVQVSHDENRNHKVDRALFGIPKEGIGFSRDAPIRMSPPKWEDAQFDLAGARQTVRLRMRYMLGASGPQR
jgi:uncharacterized protein (DUF2141 family)